MVMFRIYVVKLLDILQGEQAEKTDNMESGGANDLQCQ